MSSCHHQVLARYSVADMTAFQQGWLTCGSAAAAVTARTPLPTRYLACKSRPILRAAKPLSAAAVVRQGSHPSRPLVPDYDPQATSAKNAGFPVKVSQPANALPLYLCPTKAVFLSSHWLQTPIGEALRFKFRGTEHPRLPELSPSARLMSR